MGIKQDLLDKIESKKAEIAKKEHEIKMIYSFIAGIQEAIKSLPSDEENEKSNTNVGYKKVSNKERELRPGSDPDKARQYLKTAGKPLHIDEILKGIGGNIEEKKNKVSLVWSLNFYSKEGRIFTKTGPNTFGLTEFNQLNNADDSQTF